MQVYFAKVLNAIWRISWDAICSIIFLKSTQFRHAHSLGVMTFSLETMWIVVCSGVHWNSLSWCWASLHSWPHWWLETDHGGSICTMKLANTTNLGSLSPHPPNWWASFPDLWIDSVGSGSAWNETLSQCHSGTHYSSAELLHRPR